MRFVFVLTISFFTVAMHLLKAEMPAADKFVQAILKSTKLNTVAQQREAGVQGRSLPPISASVLREGIERNFRSYNDLEFVYNVKSKNKNGIFENTQHTFRVHIPAEGLSWQCIIVKKDDAGNGNDLQIDNFAVFNGEETHEFNRAKPQTVFESLSNGNSQNHTASKTRGFRENIFMFDSYPIFLTASSVGIPFTMLDPKAYEKFWDERKDLLKTPTKIVLYGRDVLIYNYKKNDNEYEARYLINDDCYVLVGTSRKNTKTGKLSEEIQVEEVGEKDGAVFPKKGHIYRDDAYFTYPDSKYKGTDYFFEIIKVERLQNVTSENWLPEMPAGTIVSDYVRGGVTTIPHVAKEPSPPQYTRYFAALLFITLGIFVVVYGIYTILNKRRKTVTVPE